MKRTEHPPRPAAEASCGTVWKVESALYTPAAHDGSRALFLPRPYEPNYAYPLIVWLHAPGRQDERQLMWIMPQVSMQNFVAVAPRGFLRRDDSGTASYDWPETEDHIQEADQRVFEAIEVARRQFHVAEHRVFLAGFDAGGTMAFRIAMEHPHRFAGVLSLCGAFPGGRQPFRRLTEARRLPIFLALGRDSLRYSPSMACDDLRLLHTAGFCITLRQYPCGHELDLRMLADVNRWIMDLVMRPQSPADSDRTRPCPSE